MFQHLQKNGIDANTEETGNSIEYIFMNLCQMLPFTCVELLKIIISYKLNSGSANEHETLKNEIGTNFQIWSNCRRC